MYQLKQFIGKVCTIYVTPTNRIFTDQQFVDYFVGIVESVDGAGNLITKHPTTGCLNFFFVNQIIAVCEEQLIYPEDEEQEKKILDAIPTISPNPPETLVAGNDSPFIDIDALSKL